MGTGEPGSWSWLDRPEALAIEPSSPFLQLQTHLFIQGWVPALPGARDKLPREPGLQADHCSLELGFFVPVPGRQMGRLRPDQATWDRARPWLDWLPPGLVLTLKLLHPRKLLSSEQTRTVGHPIPLFRPFSLPKIFKKLYFRTRSEKVLAGQSRGQGRDIYTSGGPSLDHTENHEDSTSLARDPKSASDSASDIRSSEE